MPLETLNEPWRSFLEDLDEQLTGPTELHCFGGFVVAEYYGVSRATADVDVIAVIGASRPEDLQRIAGRGSALAKRHKGGGLCGRLRAERGDPPRRGENERGDVSQVTGHFSPPDP